MRILDRYLLKLFLQHFLIILTVLTGLYGMIEFLEKIDNFIEQRAGLVYYLTYPFYKLPQMLTQVMPMAVLLAVFATIGLLARTQQLTAFKSCGTGVGRIARPLFLAGGVLGIVIFAGGWLVPWATREARIIFTAKVKGDTRLQQQTNDLYFRDGQRIISIDRSFPQRNEIQGLALFDFDEQFRLIRRLEADRAVYLQNGRWQLSGAVTRSFGPAGEITAFARHRELAFDLGRRPDDLVELWYQPEEMSSPELWQLSERLEREGHDARRFRAEWQLRLAQTFTPLIMVLLGIPFALQRGRQANLGVGVALTLATFAGYHLLQAVGMALGNAALLPLPVAAWAANTLLMLIGAWLFLTLDD